MRTQLAIAFALLLNGSASYADRAHGGGQTYNPFAGGSPSKQARAGSPQQGGQQQPQQQQGRGGQNGGGQSGTGAAGGGGGGMSAGGGGGMEYKPRMQDKIFDGAMKGAEPFQKKAEESFKNFSTETAKGSQELAKAMKEAKIPESDALLKELAKQEAVAMTGTGKEAVNGIVSDMKNLADTEAKIYQTLAAAQVAAPTFTPTPLPETRSVADQIAALTGGRAGGGTFGSALGTASSGRTSELPSIKAELGGGQHSESGAVRGAVNSVTSFSQGSTYNPPSGAVSRK